MRTLIQNTWILTMDDEMHEYRQGDIVLEENKISYVGEPLEHPDIDYVVDGRHSIAMPGMVNTHCHVPMIPFRSLGDDCPDRLRRFLFPLENSCMTKRLTYLSAKYGMAEMLLSGITTFADMYYFMDDCAQAAEEMGIRALLAESVIDQKSCDAANDQEGLKLGKDFIAQWQGHELVRPMLSLHATNTNKAATFKKAMEIVQKYDTLLACHVAEMDYEMKYFKDTYGMTPIEWLESLNCLNERLLAVHCIHVNEHDIELMDQNHVKISHCICSNIKAGKGVPPIRDMANRHMDIGFGTDGPSSGNTLDLFIQMRMFAGTQKTRYHDRSLFPAKEIVKMATIGGARALKMDQEIGSIEVGKKADIVLISLDSVHMFPCHDPYSLIVYSANSSDVKEVFVNGVHLVKNGVLGQDYRSLREELDREMQEFNRQAQELSQKVF